MISDMYDTFTMSSATWVILKLSLLLINQQKRALLTHIICNRWKNTFGHPLLCIAMCDDEDNNDAPHCQCTILPFHFLL